MTDTTALSEFREAVATALEGSTPSPSDATVYTDMVDAVSPPAYLLVWGSPWIESSTFCLELVRLDVVCIAGRVEPAPGIATLETMVATAKNRLRAARFPQVVTQPPARFDIGGVAYLAARLTVEVKLAIPSPEAPIEGGALLTVTATLTVAGVVVGAAVIDGAVTLTAAATLTVAGTVVGAPVIDGAVTLTAAATLTAAGTVLAAGGWTPASLGARLASWWDPSDPATITASGSPAKLSAWANKKSGGVPATQGTAAAQPTTGTRTLNSLNVLDFDGTTDWLGFGATGNPLFGASAGHAFYVMASDNDPGAGTPGSVLETWGNGGQASLEPYTDGNIYHDFGTNARKTVGNPTPSLTTPHLIEIWSAASDWGYAIDGTNIFTTPTNTVGWTFNAFIGGDGTFSFDGRIAEIFVTNAKLTGTDLTDARDYLKNKWGTP